MKQFQAKDIQKLVDIKKHRYEYIASKIGIKPEIDEVEKTGHVHLYSFKNLLEFAFVHKANDLGVTRKAVKEMLGFLSNNIALQEAGLFDPEKTIKALLHYADSNDGKIFKLFGPSISAQDKKGFFLGEGFDAVKELLKRLENKENEIGIPGVKEATKNLTSIAAFADLADFDGYITINLGAIKDRILEKLKEYF
jgi:hypothetical protein